MSTSYTSRKMCPPPPPGGLRSLDIAHKGATAVGDESAEFTTESRSSRRTATQNRANAASRTRIRLRSKESHYNFKMHAHDGRKVR